MDMVCACMYKTMCQCVEQSCIACDQIQCFFVGPLVHSWLCLFSTHGLQGLIQAQMQFCCGHCIAPEAVAQFLAMPAVNYVDSGLEQAPSGQSELIGFADIISKSVT